MSSITSTPAAAPTPAHQLLHSCNALRDVLAREQAELVQTGRSLDGTVSTQTVSTQFAQLRTQMDARSASAVQSQQEIDALQMAQAGSHALEGRVAAGSSSGSATRIPARATPSSAPAAAQQAAAPAGVQDVGSLEPTPAQDMQIACDDILTMFRSQMTTLNDIRTNFATATEEQLALFSQILNDRSCLNAEIQNVLTGLQRKLTLLSPADQTRYGQKLTQLQEFLNNLNDQIENFASCVDDQRAPVDPTSHLHTRLTEARAAAREFRAHIQHSLQELDLGHEENQAAIQRVIHILEAELQALETERATRLQQLGQQDAAEVLAAQAAYTQAKQELDALRTEMRGQVGATIQASTETQRFQEQEQRVRRLGGQVEEAEFRVLNVRYPSLCAEIHQRLQAAREALQSDNERYQSADDEIRQHSEVYERDYSVIEREIFEEIERVQQTLVARAPADRPSAAAAAGATTPAVADAVDASSSVRRHDTATAADVVAEDEAAADDEASAAERARLADSIARGEHSVAWNLIYVALDERMRDVPEADRMQLFSEICQELRDVGFSLDRHLPDLYRQVASSPGQRNTNLLDNRNLSLVVRWFRIQRDTARSVESGAVTASASTATAATAHGSAAR